MQSPLIAHSNIYRKTCNRVQMFWRDNNHFKKRQCRQIQIYVLLIEKTPPTIWVDRGNNTFNFKQSLFYVFFLKYYDTYCEGKKNQILLDNEILSLILKNKDHGGKFSTVLNRSHAVAFIFCFNSPITHSGKIAAVRWSSIEVILGDVTEKGQRIIRERASNDWTRESCDWKRK